MAPDNKVIYTMKYLYSKFGMDALKAVYDALMKSRTMADDPNIQQYWKRGWFTGLPRLVSYIENSTDHFHTSQGIASEIWDWEQKDFENGFRYLLYYLQGNKIGKIGGLPTPVPEGTPITGYGVGHFKEAIDRRYDQIKADYSRPKKEGHWSWFLFPLLREAGLKPSAGTAAYYLEGLEDIKDFLLSPELKPFYLEALRFLASLIVKGRRLRRPMSPDQALKSWLGGQDYLKVIKHVQQFLPVAEELGLKVISGLYRKILNHKIQHIKKTPPKDAFQQEFGDEEDL